VARYREVEDVALADAAIADAGVVEPAAGECQHLAVEIDAEAALDLGTEHFQDPARSRAEVQQGAERAVPEHGADFCFDGVIGGVKAPDAVPVGGMAAEIVLRRLDSYRTHDSQPFAVAGDGRIGGIQRPDEVAGNGCRRTVLGAAKKGPCTLAEP